MRSIRSLPFAACVVAVLSLIVTVVTLWFQRRHNVLSVRPIAAIVLEDYEDRITVKITNNGVGPLILQRLLVSDGAATKGSVIEWMDDMPPGTTWDTFIIPQEGRSLASGKEMVLLQLSRSPDDKLYRQRRDLCREKLKRLTIEVRYMDIYSKKIKPSQRKLDWFARTK